MPTHPGKSTTSAFLEGLSAGFARQNISGAIREGRRADEARFKQQQFDSDVQEFQFSIGDSPSAKKSFQEMQKRNPGWNRDPKVFRQFVSNYHTLNDTNSGIERAANAGVFGPNPDPFIKTLQKLAIDDPEGTGKLVLSQVLSHQALSEKNTAINQKAARESQVKGLALRMRNSPDPREFERQLEESGVPAGTIADIRKFSESFARDTTAADGTALGAQALFDARRLNTPEDIQSAANEIQNPLKRAAFIDEATKNMLTSQQLGKIADEAQVKQEELKDVTDLMLEEGLSSSSTDAEIRAFMRDTFEGPDAVKKINTSQIRVALKVANKVRAIERKQKIARKSESSKELVSLKGSGLDTSKYSSDSVANNYVRFDPEKFQQTRVFSTDANIKSSGIVKTPGVGSGVMMVTNFADDSFAGADIPNLNGKPTYYQMEKNSEGDIIPVLGEDGNPVVISPEAAKEPIRNMFFETTPEKTNPLRSVVTLVDDLMSKIKDRDDITKEVDTGKTSGRSRRPVTKKVPNTDTPHGLMFIQLQSLKDSMRTHAVGKRTRAETIDEGEDQNIDNAVDAYLKYQELRNKLINTESGFYNRKAQ